MKNIKFVKFMFAWYDCYMGIYIDRKKKLIYFLYFPMCAVVLSYKIESHCKCEGEYCNVELEHNECWLCGKPILPSKQCVW